MKKGFGCQAINPCDPKLEMSLFSKFELSLVLYRIKAKILLRRPRNMREDQEGMKKGQSRTF